MATHWHQFSWEIDPANPADWNTSIDRRKKILPGQVSFIPAPGKDAVEWHRNGHGGYRTVSPNGRYAIGYVVWRCEGSCPHTR